MNFKILYSFKICTERTVPLRYVQMKSSMCPFINICYEAYVLYAYVQNVCCLNTKIFIKKQMCL